MKRDMIFRYNNVINERWGLFWHFILIGNFNKF